MTYPDISNPTWTHKHTFSFRIKTLANNLVFFFICSAEIMREFRTRVGSSIPKEKLLKKKSYEFLK